jgi:hypothetical protein
MNEGKAKPSFDGIELEGSSLPSLVRKEIIKDCVYFWPLPYGAPVDPPRGTPCKGHPLGFHLSSSRARLTAAVTKEQ